MYIIHTDGGARGNPGPAATGIVIDKDGQRIAMFGKYLGDTTNNVAEYTAVIQALQFLLKEKQKDKGEITFYLDSELVVKQLTLIYKIKNTTLQTLASDIFLLIKEWNSSVFFKHVKRNLNKEADALVNRTLDSL